jgi:predicted RNA-binding protein with PUA domain
VVTLQFTVPADLRHILDMELELLRHQMDPIVAWLERNGGDMHWSTGGCSEKV